MKLEPMTDAELEAYMGVAGTKDCAAIMATVTPEQRALYDHMRKVEIELRLWQEGLGPKPEGVIVCRDRASKIRARTGEKE